jgi:ectoine hydroxylase-related dioxygenase (phytanoyl-CoA dioxygenase family)
MLFEYPEFVPLKAGEAVAFDNRTIHGATPNRATGLRTAVAIAMTPAEAPLYTTFLHQKLAWRLLKS